MNTENSWVSTFLYKEDEYIEYDNQFGYSAVSDEDRDNDNYFYAIMGGEAMKEMLSKINISQQI